MGTRRGFKAFSRALERAQWRRAMGAQYRAQNELPVYTENQDLYPAFAGQKVYLFTTLKKRRKRLHQGAAMEPRERYVLVFPENPGIQISYLRGQAFVSDLGAA